ncbi:MULTISPECIES: hypothetical protein [Cupriavidus]
MLVSMWVDTCMTRAANPDMLRGTGHDALLPFGDVAADGYFVMLVLRCCGCLLTLLVDAVRRGCRPMRPVAIRGNPRRR